jgi:hypothetical protein
MKAYKFFILLFLPFNVALNLILFKSYYSLLESQRQLIHFTKEMASSSSKNISVIPLSNEMEPYKEILDNIFNSLNIDSFMKPFFSYFSIFMEAYKQYIPIYFRDFVSSVPFFILFLFLLAFTLVVSIIIYNDRYDNIIVNQNKRIYLLESFISYKFNKGLPLSVLDQQQWSPTPRMRDDADLELDPMYEFWLQMRQNQVLREARRARKEEGEKKNGN